MPDSVDLSSGSVIGQEEKRIAHPLGISDENGRPPPPPVRAPTILTCGSDFITATKLLAALKQDRLRLTNQQGVCAGGYMTKLI